MDFITEVGIVRLQSGIYFCPNCKKGFGTYHGMKVHNTLMHNGRIGHKFALRESVKERKQ